MATLLSVFIYGYWILKVFFIKVILPLTFPSFGFARKDNRVIMIPIML